MNPNSEIELINENKIIDSVTAIYIIRINVVQKDREKAAVQKIEKTVLNEWFRALKTVIKKKSKYLIIKT